MQQACGRPAICLHLFYRLSTGLLQACHNPVHKIRPATCLLQACDKPVQASCMPVAGLPQAYFFYKGWFLTKVYAITRPHHQSRGISLTVKCLCFDGGNTPLSETTGHLSQVATVFTHCCKFMYKYNNCKHHNLDLLSRQEHGCSSLVACTATHIRIETKSVFVLLRYMYSTCTVHVQYMYSTCTVHVHPSNGADYTK